MQNSAWTSRQTSVQINSALQLLYGGKLLSPVVLESLQLDELKSTFRQRAMELHPDRASVLGRDPVTLNRQFRDVKLAYETLRELLESGKIPMTSFGTQDRAPQPADPPPPGRETASNRNSNRNGNSSSSWEQGKAGSWRPGAEQTRASSNQRKQGQEKAESSGEKANNPGNEGNADHYWEAEIPTNRLLFGQFLYYAGLVSWQTLISAITWQRGQRPPFGKIARMWDYLTDEEIRRIIESRDRGERIGEAAIRHGLLSQFQFNAVMGFQKWMQRPIGEYFQEIGILEDEEIQYLVGLLKKHNGRVERMEWF